MRDLTKDEAAALGLEGPRGAWVVKPIDGSHAATAGLAAGDVIVSLDGVEIDDHKALIAALVAKAPGAEVKLRLMREKRFRPLTITLAARPGPVAKAPGPSPLHLMLDTGGHMSVIRAPLL